jgi:tetratricopeptide (TPR) repeat protein
MSLFLGGAGAAQAGREDAAAKKAKSYFDEGQKHYQIGEYQKALDAFKAGYLAKPNASFLYNLGQCYRQMKQPEDAIREYKAYLRESPNAPNRADVEGFLKEMEKLQSDRDAEAKAAAAKAADDAKAAQAAQSAQAQQVAQQSATPTAAATEKPRSKWWIAGVVAGVVVVGAGVGLAVALTSTTDAPDHAGSAGSFMPTF